MIDNCKLGKNVKIPHPDLVNLYSCEIGDDSFIGPFVEITSGVKIGKRCRIQSHSFICAGVIIEDDVFIGAHTIILKGSKIGKGSVIGAGSVVSKDIPEGQIWAGNPIRYIKDID